MLTARLHGRGLDPLNLSGQHCHLTQKRGGLCAPYW